MLFVIGGVELLDVWENLAKKAVVFFKKIYRYLINSRDIWDFLGIFDWKMITLEEIPCAVPWYKVKTKHKTYYFYVIDFTSDIIRYYLAFFSCLGNRKWLFLVTVEWTVLSYELYIMMGRVLLQHTYVPKQNIY